MLERARELGVGLGFLSDAVSVNDVALAFVAAPPPTCCAVRADIAHIAAVVDEELSEVPPQASGVLDAPTAYGCAVTGPSGRLDVARDVIGEVLDGYNTAPVIENRSSERRR